MTSYKQIMADIASLEKEIEILKPKAQEALDSERALSLPDLMAKIKELGLAASDLGLGRQKTSGTTKSSVPGVPKFKDPISGKTWSGRGSVPNWIKDKDRTQFLIDAPAELSS
ncbi:MAG: H-NS histone family protein [Pseudomonadota bacterium]